MYVDQIPCPLRNDRSKNARECRRDGDRHLVAVIPIPVIGRGVYVTHLVQGVTSADGRE